MPETDELHIINTSNNGHTPSVNVKSNDDIRFLKTDISYNENKQLENSHMNTILVTNDNKDESPAFSKLVDDFDANLELDHLKYKYLLKLIEINKATLSNDKEGILDFFMSKLSNEELNMTFPEWLTFTINHLTKDYKHHTNKKLELLDREFLHAKRTIDDLDINNENGLNTLKTIIHFLENPGN